MLCFQEWLKQTDIEKEILDGIEVNQTQLIEARVKVALYAAYKAGANMMYDSISTIEQARTKNNSASQIYLRR